MRYHYYDHTHPFCSCSTGVFTVYIDFGFNLSLMLSLHAPIASASNTSISNAVRFCLTLTCPFFYLRRFTFGLNISANTASCPSLLFALPSPLSLSPVRALEQLRPHPRLSRAVVCLYLRRFMYQRERSFFRGASRGPFVLLQSFAWLEAPAFPSPSTNELSYPRKLRLYLPSRSFSRARTCAPGAACFILLLCLGTSLQEG